MTFSLSDVGAVRVSTEVNDGDDLVLLVAATDRRARFRFRAPPFVVPVLAPGYYHMSKYDLDEETGFTSPVEVVVHPGRVTEVDL